VGTTPDNKVLNAEFQYGVIQGGLTIPTGYTGSCKPMLHGLTLWE
jgi:hypothetical protein